MSNKKRNYTLKLKKANTVRRNITKKNQKEVIELYKEISKEISNKIKNKKNKYSKTYLKQVQRNLEKEIRKINEQIISKSKYGMVEVSDAVIYDVRGFLRDSGFRPNVLKGALSNIPTDVVRNILTGNLYNKKYSLSNSIWKNLDETEKDIRKIIAKGIASGRDMYEIAKDLEKYVNPSKRKDYDWSKMYPGVNKKVDYNAQRLVRTTISHAYQQSLKLACEDNPFVIGYRWITADLHGRTCDLCRERAYEDHHGMGTGIFPKNELPLDHPNGFCEFEPVMSGSLDEIKEQVINWGLAPLGTYPEIDRYVRTFRSGGIYESE